MTNIENTRVAIRYWTKIDEKKLAKQIPDRSSYLTAIENTKVTKQIPD
jgi:hypothetical protein